MKKPLTALALPVLLSASAGAQQFQQVTAFPGTAFWSEGVECADVDQDGDLDIFVADGDGFASAGTQRQNRLWINQHAQGQSWTIVDESIATSTSRRDSVSSEILSLMRSMIASTCMP